MQSTLRLKQSFLNMFFCLINNYLICYKEEQTAEDSAPKTANEIYDFDKYLSFFDEQRRPFMSELCKTQSFMNFIERSYKAKEEKNEVLFFAEGVKLCADKGDKALAMRVKRITEQLLERNKNVWTMSNVRLCSRYHFPLTNATSCIRARSRLRLVREEARLRQMEGRLILP